MMISFPSRFLEFHSMGLSHSPRSMIAASVERVSAAWDFQWASTTSKAGGFSSWIGQASYGGGVWPNTLVDGWVYTPY